eukprot:5686275-Prymnesium_polylepis.1
MLAATLVTALAARHSHTPPSHSHSPAAAAPTASTAEAKNSVAEARLSAAQQAAMAGDWEGCASAYIEAYLRSDRAWSLQYNCLSGFASVLREGHFPAGESRPTAPRHRCTGYRRARAHAARESGPATPAHRVLPQHLADWPLRSPTRRAQAHFSLGFLKHSEGDERAAVEQYSTAVEVTNALGVSERAVRVSLPGKNGWDQIEVGQVADDLVKHSTANLKLLRPAGGSSKGEL